MAGKVQGRYVPRADMSVFKGMKWKSLSHLYVFAPLSIAQVAASWKPSNVPLLSMRPCLLWTKLWLYNACILPIFLYGSEVWSVTSSLSKKIDALDNWCLRRILHIHWTDFVSNEEVQTRTGQPFLSDTIRGRRLSFFRHLSQDHSRALQSCILGPPRDWHRRVGTPRQSWLRTVEDNL